MSTPVYTGAISADGRPIAEGGANGQGGTFALKLDGLAPDTDAYIQKVLGYAPIAYYALNDDGGTTAEDLSGNGYNGTYSGAAPGGAGIGDGNTGASFDGTGDVINISAMRTAFNGNVGSISLWAKAAAWADATIRYLIRLAVSGSNQVYIQKSATANQLVFNHTGASTVKSISDTSLAGDTDYFHVALTWDAGELKAYINGAQVGATLTGLGTFTGTVLNGSASIGAAASNGVQSWSGQIAHVPIFNRALTAEEIADLATV